MFRERAKATEQKGTKPKHDSSKSWAELQRDSYEKRSQINFLSGVGGSRYEQT